MYVYVYIYIYIYISLGYGVAKGTAGEDAACLPARDLETCYITVDFRNFIVLFRAETLAH